MGFIGGCKASGVLAKIAVIILFLASACILVSISATGWGIADNAGKLGLWRLCSSDQNAMNCTDFTGWAVDWWEAVVAMTVLGTVGTLLAWLICMTYMFHRTFMSRSECAYVSAILAILAGLCILVALIVFGVKFTAAGIYNAEHNSYGFELYYCFWLLIPPSFLDLLAGVFLFIDGRRSTGVKL